MENKDIITKNIEKYMNIALNEAKKAYKKNEVPVGAIIVSPDGKIVSKAYNKVEISKNPTNHAEIIAITKATKKLNQKYLMDYSIFVTLEPCPMCAAAISLAKIKNIYFAATDEKGGGIINTVKLFENSKNLFKPQISFGIRENESKNLLKTFFKKLRKK